MRGSFAALAQPGLDGVLAFSLGAAVVAGFLATDAGKEAAARWRCCLLFSGFLPDDPALRGTLPPGLPSFHGSNSLFI